MSLAGHVALVTGSSSGIGRAIALRLAQDGADVAINYHSDAAGAATACAEITKLGRRSVALAANVGAVGDAQQMIAATVAQLGRIDILVNNAGIEIKQPFLEVTEENYDLVLNVNLRGAFFCAQAAAREMIRQGQGGRIINISSVHEDISMPGNSPYCASKGGMRMLMRTICVELAPHGITVNDVGPGAIATPINRATLADPQLVAALEAEIPEHRLGTPEEVAGVVSFLASPEAAYVTGSTYFIDGGLMRNAGGL
jgi:glucose 1-dehydrogenase